MARIRVGEQVTVYRTDGVWRCPLCPEDGDPMMQTREDKEIFVCISNRHKFYFTRMAGIKNMMLAVRMEKNIYDSGVIGRKTRIFIYKTLRKLRIIKNKYNEGT